MVNRHRGPRLAALAPVAALVIVATAACATTTPDAGSTPTPPPGRGAGIPAVTATAPTVPAPAPPASTAAPATPSSPSSAPTAATGPRAVPGAGVSPRSSTPPPTGAASAAAVRSGRATHYRLGSSGNCSFPDGPRDGRYVALNAHDYGRADLCGAYLWVRGNRGSVTVRVVDQCPECPPGALDLSEQAFAQVTGDAGVTQVQWQVVSGPAQPPISYRIKEGSSAYWVGVLVMDHRNPVRTLEALTGGRWVALQRQDYNYFLAPQGLGPGPFDVRLTDSYGEQIVSRGLMPEAGRVIRTTQQLSGH